MKGQHPVYVFTYQGRAVTRCNNHAWRKALVRAGINNFRWHDLRHTWASWHVQNGKPCMSFNNWVVGQIMRWFCVMRIFQVSI